VAAGVCSLGLLAFGIGSASAAITCTDTIADQAAVNTALAGGGTVTVNGTCLGSFVAPVSVTLQGGSPGTTLTAAGLSNRTLKVENGSSATVYVKNLKITGGSKSNGAGVFADAGASLTLNLTGVTITGNAANQGGGLKAVCCNATTINLTNSTVSNNTATGEGGGIYIESNVTLNATSSTIAGNQATFEGAGIVSDGTLNLTNSSVTANAASNNSFGGGIYAVDGTTTLIGTTVSGNSAAYEGGGIFFLAQDVSITGSTISSNQTTFTGATYGGGGIWMAEVDASIASSRIVGNASGDFGGAMAIYGCSDVSLTNTTVDHNQALDNGGGIYQDADCGNASLSLDQSAVTFNLAKTGDGGGISNYADCGYTASITITGSALGDNLAPKGEGGALYNASGCTSGAATVSVGGSSIGRIGNTAHPNRAVYGGGIFNEQDNGPASVSLQSSTTVANNQASSNGGGVLNCHGASLLVSSALILMNTPNNVVNLASCP
jgi:predicted outer membrane repeat protein